jgi:hypothetical protein
MFAAVPDWYGGFLLFKAPDMNIWQRGFLYVWLALFGGSSGYAQTAAPLTPAAHAQSVTAFQQELNTEYQDPTKSPLTAEARAAFQRLPFFPADYRYYVAATFVRDSTSALNRRY